MQITVLQANDKSKLFKLTYNINSILVMVRHVDTTSEVQAEYLKFNNIRYNRWRPYGSFIQLVNKCLGSHLSDKHGDRKLFLGDLYLKFDRRVFCENINQGI